MQAVSVAPNHSVSDLTDIHLNTVVFFSAAFSGGSEFQGELYIPSIGNRSHQGTACSAAWALHTAFSLPDSQRLS